MKNNYLIILIIITTFISCRSNRKVEQKKTNVEIKENPWKPDIPIKTNEFQQLLTYIDKLKTKESVLYAKIGEDAKATLEKLDNVYIEELQAFRNGFGALRRKLENNGYRYFSTILDFENFLFLADVYAILINPIRLQVEPKIEKDTRDKAFELIKLIHKQTKSIPEKQKNKEIDKFINDTKDIRARINQGHGLLTEEERKAYRFIDYLLLIHRLKS